jgi:hypothetical protein
LVKETCVPGWCRNLCTREMKYCADDAKSKTETA